MARLVRRGSIWYAWIPRRDGGTRRVTTLCTDKKAAAVVAARLEREAVDPAHAAAQKARTEDILADYLASRIRKGCAEATVTFVRQKAGHLKRLLPVRVRAVTYAGLCAYADSRTQEGAAPATVRKEIAVLVGALQLARKAELFDRDPKTLVPELAGEYVPRTRWLTPWELVALVSHLPTARAAHVTWIVATGARWGESVRARIEDVTLDAVHLRGTKTKASRRDVPVVGPAVAMMRWALANAPGARAGHPLFSDWGNVRRDLADACRRAGIPTCTPNDLRRTFASWLRQAGVTPQLIGAALGHTTSRMTELVYGKLPSDDLGRLLRAQVTALPESRETAADPGLLMAGSAVQTDASGGTADNEISGNPRGQARSRTGDTRIFNPSSDFTISSEYSRIVSDRGTVCAANGSSAGGEREKGSASGPGLAKGTACPACQGTGTLCVSVGGGEPEGAGCGDCAGSGVA